MWLPVSSASSVLEPGPWRCQPLPPNIVTMQVALQRTNTSPSHVLERKKWLQPPGSTRRKQTSNGTTVEKGKDGVGVCNKPPSYVPRRTTRTEAPQPKANTAFPELKRRARTFVQVRATLSHGRRTLTTLHVHTIIPLMSLLHTLQDGMACDDSPSQEQSHGNSSRAPFYLP